MESRRLPRHSMEAFDAHVFQNVLQFNNQVEAAKLAMTSRSIRQFILSLESNWSSWYLKKYGRTITPSVLDAELPIPVYFSRRHHIKKMRNMTIYLELLLMEKKSRLSTPLLTPGGRSRAPARSVEKIIIPEVNMGNDIRFLDATPRAGSDFKIIVATASDGSLAAWLPCKPLPTLLSNVYALCKAQRLQLLRMHRVRRRLSSVTLLPESSIMEEIRTEKVGESISEKKSPMQRTSKPTMHVIPPPKSLASHSPQYYGETGQPISSHFPTHFSPPSTSSSPSPPHDALHPSTSPSPSTSHTFTSEHRPESKPILYSTAVAAPATSAAYMPSTSPNLPSPPLLAERRALSPQTRSAFQLGDTQARYPSPDTVRGFRAHTVTAYERHYDWDNEWEERDLTSKQSIRDLRKLKRHSGSWYSPTQAPAKGPVPSPLSRSHMPSDSDSFIDSDSQSYWQFHPPLPPSRASFASRNIISIRPEEDTDTVSMDTSVSPQRAPRHHRRSLSAQLCFLQSRCTCLKCAPLKSSPSTSRCLVETALQEMQQQQPASSTTSSPLSRTHSQTPSHTSSPLNPYLPSPPSSAAASSAAAGVGILSSAGAQLVRPKGRDLWRAVDRAKAEESDARKLAKQRQRRSRSREPRKSSSPFLGANDQSGAGQVFGAQTDFPELRGVADEEEMTSAMHVGRLLEREFMAYAEDEAQEPEVRDHFASQSLGEHGRHSAALGADLERAKQDRSDLSISGLTTIASPKAQTEKHKSKQLSKVEKEQQKKTEKQKARKERKKVRKTASQHSLEAAAQQAIAALSPEEQDLLQRRKKAQSQKKEKRRGGAPASKSAASETHEDFLSKTTDSRDNLMRSREGSISMASEEVSVIVQIHPAAGPKKKKDKGGKKSKQKREASKKSETTRMYSTDALRHRRDAIEASDVTATLLSRANSFSFSGKADFQPSTFPLLQSLRQGRVSNNGNEAPDGKIEADASAPMAEASTPSESKTLSQATPILSVPLTEVLALPKSTEPPRNGMSVTPLEMEPSVSPHSGGLSDASIDAKDVPDLECWYICQWTRQEPVVHRASMAKPQQPSQYTTHVLDSLPSARSPSPIAMYSGDVKPMRSIGSGQSLTWKGVLAFQDGSIVLVLPAPISTTKDFIANQNTPHPDLQLQLASPIDAQTEGAGCPHVLATQHMALSKSKAKGDEYKIPEWDILPPQIIWLHISEECVVGQPESIRKAKKYFPSAVLKGRNFVWRRMCITRTGAIEESTEANPELAPDTAASIGGSGKTTESMPIALSGVEPDYLVIGTGLHIKIWRIDPPITETQVEKQPHSEHSATCRGADDVTATASSPTPCRHWTPVQVLNYHSAPVSAVSTHRYSHSLLDSEVKFILSLFPKSNGDNKHLTLSPELEKRTETRLIPNPSKHAEGTTMWLRFDVQSGRCIERGNHELFTKYNLQSTWKITSCRSNDHLGIYFAQPGKIEHIPGTSEIGLTGDIEGNICLWTLPTGAPYSIGSTVDRFSKPNCELVASFNLLEGEVPREDAELSKDQKVPAVMQYKLHGGEGMPELVSPGSSIHSSSATKPDQGSHSITPSTAYNTDREGISCLVADNGFIVVGGSLGTVAIYQRQFTLQCTGKSDTYGNCKLEIRANENRPLLVFRERRAHSIVRAICTPGNAGSSGKYARNIFPDLPKKRTTLIITGGGEGDVNLWSIPNEFVRPKYKVEKAEKVYMIPTTISRLPVELEKCVKDSPIPTSGQASDESPVLTKEVSRYLSQRRAAWRELHRTDASSAKSQGQQPSRSALEEVNGDVTADYTVAPQVASTMTSALSIRRGATTTRPTFLRALRGHASRISSLYFDETKIVSASLDGAIKIWELGMPHMGRLINTLRPAATDASVTTMNIFAIGTSTIAVGTGGSNQSSIVFYSPTDVKNYEVSPILGSVPAVVSPSHFSLESRSQIARNRASIQLHNVRTTIGTALVSSEQDVLSPRIRAAFDFQSNYDIS